MVSASERAGAATYLIQNKNGRFCSGRREGQTAESGRQNPALQPGRAIAQSDLQFQRRRQRGRRIERQKVDSARSSQLPGDFERFFGGIRAAPPAAAPGCTPRSNGISRVESVFRVDPCGGKAAFLSVRDDFERQRGLAARGPAE